jgi:hypothetical protein
LCEAPEPAFSGCLVAFLLDLLAVVCRAFDGDIFADVAGFARAALRADVLGDFLRVFLDIRLPFVAFSGSIMGVLRALSRHQLVSPTAGQG